MGRAARPPGVLHRRSRRGPADPDRDRGWRAAAKRRRSHRRAPLRGGGPARAPGPGASPRGQLRRRVARRRRHRPRGVPRRHRDRPHRDGRADQRPAGRHAGAWDLPGRLAGHRAHHGIHPRRRRPPPRRRLGPAPFPGQRADRSRRRRVRREHLGGRQPDHRRCRPQHHGADAPLRDDDPGPGGPAPRPRRPADRGRPQPGRGGRHGCLRLSRGIRLGGRRGDLAVGDRVILQP